MAEAHQARMQNEVEEMVQSLERDHIRKMQVKQSSAIEGARVPSLCVSHLVACLHHRVACSAAARTVAAGARTPCLRSISASIGVTLLWPKPRVWSLPSWRSFR